MKHFRVFFASLTLSALAFLPATASAFDADELEVTMQVIDDVSDIDANVVDAFKRAKLAPNAVGTTTAFDVFNVEDQVFSPIAFNNEMDMIDQGRRKVPM